MKKYISNITDAKTALEKVVCECCSGKQMWFDYDLFLCALVNRAMMINRGFITLKNDSNVFCTIPLLRMQLENCLKIYALLLVSDPHAFLSHWFFQKKVSNFKDKRLEKKLTESYLSQQMEKSYEHVYELYKQCCGHVHFSADSIKTSMTLSGDRKIEGHINGFDIIPDNEKRNIEICFVHVNNILIDIIYRVYKELTYDCQR